MIYDYIINGLPVRSGDILCAQVGSEELVSGQFWRLVGLIVPGEVDHVAVYVGPDGKCVESGPLGVINFDISGRVRIGKADLERGLLVDRLYGVVYPLEGRGLSPEEENTIREAVVEYCLAQVGKPYNLNFFNPHTEEAFYCSQLPYLAYLPHGVDLNTGQGVPQLPGTENIIFPQEIWSGCPNRRAVE